MADILCPNCNKPNPEALEICQYCGALLKNVNTNTEPLGTLRPGDMPTKRATSDLERTLPGWLRDIRKGEVPDKQSAQKSVSMPSQKQPATPATPAQPPKREHPKKKESQSPLDFLAGLSQSGEEEEDAVPDWMASLGGTLPTAPAPSVPEQTPTDWLADLKGESAPQQAEEPEPAMDWGFNADTSLGFNAAEEPAPVDTPDWLTSLKAQDTASKAPDFTTRAAPDDQAEFSIPGDISAGRDIPAWLSNLEAETPPTPPPPAAAPPISEPAPAPIFGAPASALAGDIPDWLSNLGQESIQETESKPAKPVPADNQLFGGDLPDWLSSLGDEGATQAPAAPTFVEPEPVEDLSPAEKLPPPGGFPASRDLPDWLGNSDQEPAAPAKAALTSQAPAGDLPDWLGGLGQKPAAPVESVPTLQSPAEETPPAGNLSDWLSSLDQEPLAPAESTLAAQAPAGDLPDWLDGLGQEPAEPAPAFQAPAAEAPPAENLSDWLSSLDQEPAAPAESTPAFQAPAGESAFTGDLSDWLSNLDQEPAAATPGLQPPAMELPSTGELPDWMGGKSESKPAAAPPPEPAQAEAFTTGDLPDWLSAAIGETPAAAQPPIQAPPPAENKTSKAFPTGTLGDLGLNQTDEMPDWMSGLTAVTAAESVVAAPKADKPVVEPAEPIQPPPPFDLSTAGDLSDFSELPDWLGGLSESEGADEGKETPFETATKAPAKSESAARPPSAGPSFEIPIPAAEENQDSVFSMEVPDWLSGFTPADADQTSADEVAEQESGIGQAELPSWVQAMRPMESVMSGNEGEEDEQDIEKEGPLAGLRGVLPVQLGLPEIHKPKAYSIKLQVGATQQEQATLLEQLIASEASSQSVKPSRQALVIRPLRWTIAAVLFLAVFIPAILGSQEFPLPFTPVGETDAFHQIVENLFSEAPVLVVFDYQPGYAGELESAAAPVIDHLMMKNARLSFVSSSPSGPLMVERMMAGMRAQHGNYNAGEQYIDLGYLAGGAAGIQVFANDPQRTLGSTVLAQQDVVNLWNSRPLAGVQTLANFAAVIVLTDNPDTGRLWVEQAGPALGRKPMLMVISAQAEPMIRPYYLSGQLGGIVTGLEGGAAYEQVNARHGQARQYWDSYGLSMMAAEFLIVFGGAWALVTGIRERRSKQEEEEN